MSKAILISDHARWCALIMNGVKTIEVRKGTALYKAIQKLIDEYGYAEIYDYCTKDKETIAINPYGGYAIVPNKDKNEYFNGKVLFKFRCYKVEEIGMWNYSEYGTPTLMEDSLCLYSCLNFFELKDYIKDKPAYAIHISNIEIFDKPKELSEFNALQRAKATDCGYLKQCKNCGKRFNRCHLLKPLTKAPQSFMYIEV